MEREKAVKLIAYEYAKLKGGPGPVGVFLGDLTDARNFMAVFEALEKAHPAPPQRLMIGMEVADDLVRVAREHLAHNERMAEALNAAAGQFNFYERQHRLKGTPEADGKAEVNARMAAMCRFAAQPHKLGAATERPFVYTRPPWTDEQCDKLNEYQRCGNVHPFTCEGDHGDHSHRTISEFLGLAPGTLIAEPQGWRCPACGYTQEWAWASMLKGAPVEGAAKALREAVTASLATMRAAVSDPLSSGRSHKVRYPLPEKEIEVDGIIKRAVFVSAGEGRMSVVGDIYGDRKQRFPDGLEIRTSAIVSGPDENGIIHTRNSVYKIEITTKALGL